LEGEGARFGRGDVVQEKTVGAEKKGETVPIREKKGENRPAIPERGNIDPEERGSVKIRGRL